MKRFVTFLALILAALPFSAGCNDGLDQIDRVQTNLVDKSLFEGEWWFTQTFIDVNGEEALLGIFDNYPIADMGPVAYHPLDRPWAGNYPIGRIRWVIDEDTLFAFRSYELIDGGNDDGRDPNFRGQPLAAYPIVSHVDVRQDYDPITGELTNVRVEDTSDRHWYDRQFMRVDWSKNLITVPFNSGGPNDYDIEALSHPDLPQEWAPEFVRIGDDQGYRFQDEWQGADPATVHYMSFVTQSLYTPGTSCRLFIGGGPAPCTTFNVTYRSSFLRVPPNHGFAGETMSHREFDRFGIIRGAQRTYVRGGTVEDSRRNFCDDDADCGIGGYCNVERNICLGGLTSDYGETDFMTFYRSRHNFWVDSLTDTACLADWECDGRYGTAGGVVGSTCDRAARKCTIPLADRQIRPVVYTLNSGFPAYLSHAAFETVGIWNEAFMRGWRAVTGEAAASGENQACQTTDPTAYCLCGSPDDLGDGTCRWRYDPFQTPEAAAAAGVVNPYRCHIQNTGGFVPPEHPTSAADYPTPGVYQYEFVGDECMLVLESNSCDREPGTSCQKLGDIRYQFFNYIQHGNVFFGGVATPMVDPLNGEFIYSSINMAAESIESVGTTAREFYPVLRGDAGANDRYFGGEHVRNYYEARGNVERPPTALAASAFDGFSIGDDSRPGIPVEMNRALRDFMDTKLDRIQRLQGSEGRTQIMSDRMQLLRGSPIEQRLLGSVAQEIAGETLDFSQYDALHLEDEAVMNDISPFRDGARFGTHPWWRQVEQRYPSGMFVDPPFAPEIESSRSIYWAEKFAGYPLEEAGIRMQQAYLRGVMLHEMGHGVGLEHNFGASLDRNHYNDGYFNQVFRDDDALAIPELITFDSPTARCDGMPCPGNADGFVGGEEVNNFARELRRVRNARNELGISPHTSSSVMDYHGELSRALPDLGRYDVAAALYSHFNVVEVYDDNPVYDGASSLNGIHRATETPRVMWPSYRGGDACTVDAECPFNVARTGRPVGQTCIKNPRVSSIPLPCDADERNCVCSSFDEDMITEASSAFPEYYPVNYLSCTNFRLTDISWCTWFDAGESFQEVMDNYRRTWEQSYPLAYYRRFNRSGPTVGGAWGSIQDAVKVYQHLFFRFFYEPGFRADEGPTGFDNQFLASIDAMNWLAEIVTLPQEGSYELDAANNVYRHMGTDMAMPGADVTLPVGMGYPMWSQYEEGLNGFFRTARSGVFFDKYLALYGLAIRDWGLSYTIDDRFYINFFDLFPVESTELFGGLIIEDPSWYAPRLEVVGGEPRVTPLTWYRDQCNRGGRTVPCRPDQPTVYPEPAITDSSNEVLRDWATILALAQFPVYYDASFEQRLSVFKLGTGDGFQLPATGPTGTPLCSYNVELQPGHVTGCADPDYAVFESDRLHQSFIAVKVRSRLDYNLPEEQLGYRFLTELIDRQEDVQALRALPSPTAAQLARLRELERQLNAGESFLEYLIDVQREYGISAYFL